MSNKAWSVPLPGVVIAFALVAASCQAPPSAYLTMTVTPASLAFSATPGAPLPPDQFLKITDTGVEKLEISSITMAVANDITLPVGELVVTGCNGNPRATTKLLELIPSECVLVGVRFTPTNIELITNDVVIVSNNSQTPVVKVPVTAVNEAPPSKCPTANLPVPDIQAFAGTTPLAAGSTIPPGLVTFTGASSTVIAGASIVNYEWELLSGPATPVTSSSSSASVNAMTPGTYVIGLIVADSIGCIGPQETFTFTIAVPPCWNIKPPTAEIQAFVGSLPLPPSGILAETTVTLEGLNSESGTNPITTYSWSLVSAPSGNTASIVANGSSASIDCNAGGTYTVGLSVGDGTGCMSPPATFQITVTPLPAMTCGPSTLFIYLIDVNSVMYQFVPSTVTMTPIGLLSCPAAAGATPNTMAVDLNGTAWVEFNDETVFRVDTSTLKCFPTSFEAPSNNNSELSSWGSCFALNGPGSMQETYFVAQPTGEGLLASINTTSLQLSAIGPFSGLNGASPEPELTGTSDGRLFGFFPGQNAFGFAPWILAQINKENGAIISETSLDAIDVGVGGGGSGLGGGAGNWAFASWGEDFWFFAGPGGSTSVYHFEAATGITNLVETVNPEIVGAGVSPCVQMQ